MSTYNEGLLSISLPSKNYSYHGGWIIPWRCETMGWNQVPQAWLCVYFQEPEVSELKSVQSSNHGIYLPPDTQKHAGSGRASSMPRLTMDPQVKLKDHIPSAVASQALIRWVMKYLIFSGKPWTSPLPLAYTQNSAHGLALIKSSLYGVCRKSLPSKV